MIIEHFSSFGIDYNQLMAGKCYLFSGSVQGFRSSGLFMMCRHCKYNYFYYISYKIENKDVVIRVFCKKCMLTKHYQYSIKAHVAKERKVFISV